MKKIFLPILIALFLTVSVNVVSAHMMDGVNGESDSTEVHENLESYLPIFLKEYDAENLEDIDCSEVMNSDFERLGDSLMETNHPGEAHEEMDEMMGGEGSENLQQMHINMGKNYLNCGDNDIYGGMMNGGKMVGSYSGTYKVNRPLTWIWIVNSLLFSVLLLVLICYFWRKSTTSLSRKGKGK